MTVVRRIRQWVDQKRSRRLDRRAQLRDRRRFELTLAVKPLENRLLLSASLPGLSDSDPVWLQDEPHEAAPETNDPAPEADFVWTAPETFVEAFQLWYAENQPADSDADPLRVLLAPAAGQYTGLVLDLPDDVRLTIDGAGGQVSFTGASPALTVVSGQVVTQHGVTFETSTNDPTILVHNGGALTLIDSTVHESDAFDQAAIFVHNGGTLDLTSGNNTLNARGDGQLIVWQDTAALTIAGNTLQLDGSPLDTTAPADNFTIEDRLTHALDDADYGLVTWVPGELFVTLESGSIQRGIDAAEPGARLHVDQGTYNEDVVVPPGSAGLSLLGANAGVSANPLDAQARSPESIIDGTVRIGVSQGAANVTLDGFTVNSGASRAVDVRGLNIQVLNNRINGLPTMATSGTAAGIAIGATSSPPKPMSFQFADNFISGFRYGLLLDGTAAAYDASGVASIASGNYITNNERAIQSFGSLHGGGIVHEIRDNAIIDNDRGIRLAAGQFTVADNLLQGNTQFGVHAGVTSILLTDLTLQGNTILGNHPTGGAGLILQSQAGASSVIIAEMAISGYLVGGSITDVATINWQTTGDDDTMFVDGANSRFSASGARTVAPIHFAAADTLNVLALDGEDTIRVSAHQDTIININGGPPAIAPGDTLAYVADDTLGFQILPGQIVTAGRAVVNYTEIESLLVDGDDLAILGGSDNDLLEVVGSGEDSGNFRLMLDVGGNGQVVGPWVDFAHINSLTFNGLAGDDLMRVTNPAGSLLRPSGGLHFSGGDGDDTLEVLQGAATVLEHRFTNANDGSIHYDGDTSAAISYTGLAPILDTIDADHRVFTFTADAETITLADDVDTAGNTRLDSTLGETVSFANPTQSMAIRMGDVAGAGPDKLNISGLDSGFAADLAVDAASGDEVRFLAGTATSLVGGVTISGPASVVFETNASLLASDNVLLNADDHIRFSANSTIQTVDGDILLAAPVLLAGDTSLATQAGDITLTGTVNGAQTLSLTAGTGSIDLQNAVGSGQALDSLTIESAANVTFTSTLRTTGNVTQSAGTGTTTFNGTSGPGIGGELSVTTDAVALDSAVLTTVGPVKLDAQNTISVNPGAGLNAGASTIAMLANQDDSGAEGFTQADGTLIQTSNDTDGAISITVDGSGGAAIAALQTGANGQVTITAGGAITDAGDTHTDITAGSATLAAVGGIGSGDALETAISNLAFNNTGGGSVQISNTGGLTVASVGALSTSSNVGNTILTASSPITFDTDTTQANMLVQALESGAGTPNTDNITVNAGVTVAATAGKVVFEAGDRIVIEATAVVTATANSGEVILQSGVDDTDNDGSMTLDGTVSAPGAGGTITLNLHDQQGATQAATGTLTATNLLLLSNSHAAASFALDTSTTNDVTNLAADTSGAINYRDSASLNITTVGGTDGITATDHDVSLRTTGTITVSQAINTSPGTGGGILLTGSIVVDASLTAAGGNIKLNGSAATTSDLVINQALTSDQAMDFTAPRDIIVAAVITTTGAGSDISLRADDDHSGLGGVRVTAAGQVVSADDVTLTGSDLFATGGGNAPLDSVRIDADGTNDQIVATGNITLLQGTVTPTAAAMIIDGRISSTGAGTTILIESQRDILFGANGDLIRSDAGASGQIQVFADRATAGNTGGVITMADAAMIDGGGGAIEIVADGNITLGGLSTNSTAATAVQITSASGGVIDGGDTHVDIVAASGTVVIKAATGVGSVDPIETTIAVLDLTNTTSGNVRINETNTLDVNRINQAAATGTVNVVAGGPIMVVADESGISSLAGQIGLEADGSIDITAAISSAGGNVAITTTSGGDVKSTAAGTITTTASPDSGDASGAVTIQANRAVSLAGKIDTAGAGHAGGGQTASAGGNVEINAPNTVSLRLVTTGGGTATGSGGFGGDAGAIQINGAAITLNENLTARGGNGGQSGGHGGAVTLDGPLTLAQSIEIQTAGGSGGTPGVGGQLTATSTIDGAQSLSLVAGTGNIDLLDAVGGAEMLTSVTVVSAHQLTLASAVRTSGDFVQLDGTGTTTFNGTAGLGIGGALNITTNAITLDSAPMITVGTVHLDAQNAITIGAAAGLDAGASTIRIAANQDGLGSDGLTQAAGTTIQTTAATSDAIVILVGGSGDARLARIQTGAGADARITISAGGRVLDHDLATMPNLRTTRLQIVAGAGIGQPNSGGSDAKPLRTEVDLLAATATTGYLWIREATVLVLDGVHAPGPVSGVSMLDGGPPQVQIESVGGQLAVAAGTVVQSETGQVNNVPPLLRLQPLDPTAVLIPGDPTQRVTGTLGGIEALGDLLELGVNFRFFVTWNDGVVSRLELPMPGNVDASVTGVPNDPLLQAGDTILWTIDQHNQSVAQIVRGAVAEGPINVEVHRTYPLIHLQLLRQPEVAATFGLMNDPNVVLHDQSGLLLNQAEPVTIVTAVAEDMLRPTVSVEIDEPPIVIDDAPPPVAVDLVAVLPPQFILYDDFPLVEGEDEEVATKLFLVHVLPDGREGERVELALTELRDLSGLLKRLEAAPIPSGLYRLYYQEPGLPPQQVLEFRKTGDMIGDPVRQPGRGSRAEDSPADRQAPDQGDGAVKQRADSDVDQAVATSGRDAEAENATVVSFTRVARQLRQWQAVIPP